jgi:hypothetical protein
MDLLNGRVSRGTQTAGIIQLATRHPGWVDNDSTIHEPDRIVKMFLVRNFQSDFAIHGQYTLTGSQCNRQSDFQNS